MMKALRHVLELFQSTHPGLASVKLVTMSLTAFGPWFRCFFGQYDRDKIKNFYCIFFLQRKLKRVMNFSCGANAGSIACWKAGGRGGKVDARRRMGLRSSRAAAL